MDLQGFILSFKAVSYYQKRSSAQHSRPPLTLPASFPTRGNKCYRFFKFTYLFYQNLWDHLLPLLKVLPFFFFFLKENKFVWLSWVLVTAGGIFHCSVWTEQLWQAGLLLHNVWNLSSPTRDWTCVSCISRQIPNHWAAGEVPWKCFWLWFLPDDFLSFFLFKLRYCCFTMLC